MIKCKQARHLLEDVDSSIKTIKAFSTRANASDKEKSYLAKFLVVFVCGIYEEAIESIMNDRISKLRSGRLSKYFSIHLDATFRNPDIGKITGLLGMFDDSWKNVIQSLPNHAKTAFESIVTNKNAVAHGQPCNITLDDVIDFYNNSKPVIEEVDRILHLR